MIINHLPMTVVKENGAQKAAKKILKKTSIVVFAGVTSC
jgi:hypothetical protein